MTKVIAASVTLFLAALLAPAFGSGFGEARQQPAAPTLDFEYFKKNIQPIFVKRRPGHARCVACHVGATPMNLQPLAKGSATWTEEETRKNFDAVQKVAMAGNPKSTLLVHPLEEQAGGDFYHSGGKHWASQSDPEWQLLRTFVMGQTK
jgi:hypothetical protein